MGGTSGREGGESDRERGEERVRMDGDKRGWGVGE